MQIQRLQMINNEVYNYIFPQRHILLRKPDVSYKTNNIFQRQMLIVGGQQSGKTTSAQMIALKAIDLYGQSNVNAVSSRDFELLMNHGIKRKLVNILYFDDATLTKVPNDTLRDYFRIRHIMSKKTGYENGLIITIVGTHRFHSMPKELRSTCNVSLWKSSPTNPYDRRTALGFIGDDGIQFLESIELQKQHKPELIGVGVVYFLNNIGLFITPQPKINVMTELVWAE